MLTLQAKDLTVNARIGGTPVPAINALSFDLAPGKILGLVGESGAGKSMQESVLGAPSRNCWLPPRLVAVSSGLFPR